MRKELSEMTLEELWQLFPIQMSEHREKWREWFLKERDLLRSAMQENAISICHIGSTNVKGICAKPIVDILVETDDLPAARDAAVACGYRVMSEEEDRISLNKGYTPEGFAEKVFHLHLRRMGDCDEIYFREYMRMNPEKALAYEAMKKQLKERYEFNRNAYTDGKGEFIRGMTQSAKERMRRHGGYIFRPMGQGDVAAMFALVLKRMRWMDATGIRQWNVTKYDEEYPPEHYARECEKGTMYALVDFATGDMLAAGALRTEDWYWDDGANAFYLHHFASEPGSGTGSVFLELAEMHAAENGAEFFRLDSADDNPRLEKYYEEKGYLPAGTCRNGLYTGILRQKRLR